jgi:plastocyanin
MRTLLIVLIIALVAVGGWLVLRGDEASAPESDTEMGMETGDDEEEGTEQGAEEHIITYSDSGYSPSEVRVSLGDTVTWRNESSGNMWTASAVHPTHTIYSGTSLSEHCPDAANASFDACEGIAPGAEWSFTFDEAGSWGYHNHLNAAHTGRVVVE